MSVGNIFGKRKLFEKREPIDAKRFCEIWYDYLSKETYLENPVITAVFEKDGQKYYQVNVIPFVPPKCKIQEPFEVFYHEATEKLYAVPQDNGYFRFMFDNKPVTLNGSDMVSIKNRTLAGRIPLELAETFREEEYI